jgi:hypothetical protein
MPRKHALFKMKRTPRQLELRVRTWGGRRRGAGRKPAAGRRSTPHRRRPAHDPRCPVHVTLRAERAPHPAQRPRLRRRSARARQKLTRFLPPPTLQCSMRSSAPARGGGHADEARARRAGARHPRSARDQPRRPATRARVARPLSRTCAPRTAGSSERARVRTPELPETSPCRSGNRSAVVGALVRGLAPRRCGPLDRGASRRPSCLARAGRMAAAWVARRHRDAAETLRVRATSMHA